MGREVIRLQAKVSGNQGHSARAEAETLWVVMRESRATALRLFEQQTASSREASSPNLDPPRNKMV